MEQGESRRLQKAAVLFAEDHVLGGFVLGCVEEQKGLQFLLQVRQVPPSRLLWEMAWKTSWVLALTQQRGTYPAANSVSSFLPAISQQLGTEGRRLERSVNI